MHHRPVRFSLVLLVLAMVFAIAAGTASAGPLLGRWEGHSAKGATVAFLLGEYDGETLIADAGVLCPPGSDPEESDASSRAGQLDPFLEGKNGSTWRTLERVEDGIIDTSHEASWYSEKLGSTGVLSGPIPTLAKGALGHSTGVITKVERLGLPCKVGRLKVHHVTTAVRPDGSYTLAAIPAGEGKVGVTAGGAFVSVEASLAVPSVDPDNPAPCLPYYSTEALETHGGGDAFGIVLDEPSVATPVEEVGITGTFTGKATITGAFLGKTALIGGPTCAVVASFIAKAPKKPVRPRLDLTGTAPGGQAG